MTEQLGMVEAALRVVAPDVGGGFGYKGKLYPEEAIVVWAARRLHRPVRWLATRAESFLADNQGRDHITQAELALDSDGHFLALRVRTCANLGAYVSTFGAAIPSAIYTSLLAGVYRTPAIFVESTGIFTNTVPTDAYRGAGRPEACYVLERLADKAATELGFSRDESAAQFRLAVADAVSDTGRPDLRWRRFPRMFARALTLAGYEFELRRAGTVARGGLRGIGLACYVDYRGWHLRALPRALGARAGFFESATIRVEPDGSVRAALGTHDHGQGHASSLARIPLRGLACPWNKSK